MRTELTGEEKSCLLRDGYVVIDNAVSSAAIAAARQLIESYLLNNKPP